MRDKINSIRFLIERFSLDAVLISSVPNIIYLTSYSGFSYLEREAFLVITHKENFLITDGRYSEAVASLPKYELIEISSLNSFDKILKNLSKKIKKIGIEENNLTISEYRRIKKYFKTANLKELQNLRFIKNSFEIKSIEKACRLGDKAFDFILKKIKLGVTEKQIAFELEFFVKKNGGDLSFPSIVAFGKNSSIPHHQTSDELLKNNSIVLLDFGVKLNNYCSDMTRTIFFGKANDKFKKMYTTVFNAQKKAIESLKSSMVNDKWSIRASDVDHIARKYITDEGFPTIPHSLGHGIGIEVHEAPRLSPKSKDILKSGMVFSIEPGIYIPGFGGVRMEDLVVLEKNEPRLLTHSPKHLIEI